MRNCSLIMFICFSIVSGFAQERTIGLFVNEKEASKGYVLYSSNQYTSTYLLDNCGQVINEWESEFTPGLASYLDDDSNLVRAGVFRESNTFINAGTGGILQRFDWDGTLEWQVTINNDSIGLHHDFHVMDNGNILAIAWKRVSPEDAVENGRNPELIGEEIWSEVILEIRPEGSDAYGVVWEWHVFDHLIQDYDLTKTNFGSVSENPQLFNVNNVPSLSSDWLHFNSVYYDETRDQIVISCREMNEIWIIDHSTTSAEAASHEGGNSGKGGDLLFRWGNDLTFDSLSNRVFLEGQHDAEFEEDGSITIFNNRNEVNGGSQILKIQPEYINNAYVFDDGYQLTAEPVNLLEGLESNFTSDILSSVQLMENDNIMVCKGVNSDFQEYSQDGDLVWQYIGPVSLFGPNAQGSNTVGQTFKIIKYNVDDIRFDGLELDVLYSQLELDPLPYECNLHTATTETTVGQVDIYMDSQTETLIIEGERLLSFMLFSIDGKLLKVDSLNSGRNNFDLSGLLSALYVIQVERKEGKLSKMIFKY